jgi:phosphoenolpyruvate carboxykinase (GTP)
MAMLPFCGYHMGDYFSHWLNMRKLIKYPPRIFHVNWFRKENGEFLWPGFGENMRVLKWIVQRSRGCANSHESPVGWTPSYDDFDWTGMEHFSRERFERLQRIDPAEWRKELAYEEELFIQLHDRLPAEMVFQRQLLISRL